VYWISTSIPTTSKLLNYSNSSLRSSTRRSARRPVRSSQKRKWLANQSLHTTAGMEKLHNIQHKLKAACYSSFSFGMDLEYMFKKFDKDGNGTLDYEEVRVCEERSD
jgi:hypothetical protein